MVAKYNAAMLQKILGHLWSDIVEETDARCSDVAPDRTLVVRYEDLCADPRGCLARVLELKPQS